MAKAAFEQTLSKSIASNPYYILLLETDGVNTYAVLQCLQLLIPSIFFILIKMCEGVMVAPVKPHVRDENTEAL